MVTYRMRHSAAVLLTRGEGAELEVYLVERAPELRFFGGYWALPGGVVDAVDRRGEEEVSRVVSQRAALRELFEETGVLPTRLHSAIPEELRAGMRTELSARESETARWSGFASQVDEACEALRFVTQFTTPLFAAVRHTTPFFHMHLPREQEPRIERGELVDGRFFRPAELLKEWRAGVRPVAAPVLFMLQMLRDGDLDVFHTKAEAAGEAVAQGQLHRARFSPGVMIAPLLTPTLPPALTTNAIFVGEERVYLVDPATYEERERARLYETMDRWIEAGRRFEGVLLTHHHSDHIGSAAVTCERYELPLLAHAETLQRVDAGSARTVELKHGDSLDLGHSPDGRANWKLDVLHTPGHAPGHLAFIEDRYRAAIVGDMVSTLSTIVIDPPEGHMATYLESLRLLRDADIGTLHPAHGPAQLRGRELLVNYLQHREAREQKLVGALASGAATLDELLPLVYDDAPQELMEVAKRSLLAGLIKLGEERHEGALAVLDRDRC
jgi:glyoxylase-like metal-dependent hydrolase (beta-lactamase superfamily II)/8-oxo-dGTP pyrophosphatase MutT (NUDIX family)